MCPSAPVRPPDCVARPRELCAMGRDSCESRAAWSRWRCEIDTSRRRIRPHQSVSFFFLYSFPFCTTRIRLILTVCATARESVYGVGRGRVGPVVGMARPHPYHPLFVVSSAPSLRVRHPALYVLRGPRAAGRATAAGTDSMCCVPNQLSSTQGFIKEVMVRFR